MKIEGFERIIDPKIIVESYAEQHALANDVDIEILQNQPDLLQFQVVWHPEGNPLQIIALGKEDTDLFLETLLDNLETDHPEFFWKNGLELSETQGAVCIFFYPDRLSEEA